MTLIVLEGLSASGKSTVRDALIERNPEWVMWKGENLMRKGMGDYWIDYQRRYHEALHRLYELNPDNVIIADRAFTDCVYNSDPQMRKEMRRLAACYGNAHILYFYPGKYDTDEVEGRANHALDGVDVLRQRGSRDMYKVQELMERYNKLLQMFDHSVINTAKRDVPESVAMCEKLIENIHGTDEHNPDV